jgi:hypothetical protein
MRLHLMTKRDNPGGDFDRMAPDISVDHPTVVAAAPATFSVSILLSSTNLNTASAAAIGSGVSRALIKT